MTVTDFGSETNTHQRHEPVEAALVCPDHEARVYYQQMGALVGAHFPVMARSSEDLLTQLDHTEEKIEAVLVVAGQGLQLETIPEAVGETGLDLTVVLGDWPAMAGANLRTEPEVAKRFDEVVVPRGVDPIDDIRFTIEGLKTAVLAA